MSAYIHGSATGAAIDVGDGGRTILHRYELVGEVLVRCRVAEPRVRPGREVKLVDVLVEEGNSGRSIVLVRGIVLGGGEPVRPTRTPSHAPAPWREFPVDAALLRAIEDDLGVNRSGGTALRLATVDGVRIG